MKISVVTPCFNSSKFMLETIESVLFQKGDFELEYIIVDGGSTDGTVEYLKKIDETICKGEKSFAPAKCFKYISEPDNGMYDAVCKGFSMATGDIFAWINSDDIYLQGALQKVIDSFETFPQIKWLKGITSYIDENSNITSHGKCYIYKRNWIKEGHYGKNLFFIQQDSVFWKRDLWEKVAPIDTRLKLAGDYWLWIKMAEHAELYSLNEFISCFRQREGQLSSEMDKYYAEMDKIRKDFNLKKGLVFFEQIRQRIKEGQIQRLLLKHVFQYKGHCVFINEDGSVKMEKINRMVV